MKIKTAAIVIIGNEILSGRTQDTNINTIAKALNDKGITLKEARVIEDDIPVIIRHIHALEAEVDMIFTTGGIGPTHDDKTAEALAQAYETDLILNDDAYAMLLSHYGDESIINEGRRKMALIPKGATLIENPVSGAPGFIIGKTHCMAGIPKIVAGMLDHIMAGIDDGDPILSRTIIAFEAESVLAPFLATVQTNHSDVDIGSYPRMTKDQTMVSIVLRSRDSRALETAAESLLQTLESNNITHRF